MKCEMSEGDSTDLEDQRFVFRRGHDPAYEGGGLPVPELERHLHVYGIGAILSARRLAIHAPQLLRNPPRGLLQFWQSPCLYAGIERNLSQVPSVGVQNERDNTERRTGYVGSPFR